jgi:hypothetical protein
MTWSCSSKSRKELPYIQGFSLWREKWCSTPLLRSQSSPVRLTKTWNTGSTSTNKMRNHFSNILRSTPCVKTSNLRTSPKLLSLSLSRHLWGWTEICLVTFIGSCRTRFKCSSPRSFLAISRRTFVPLSTHARHQMELESSVRRKVSSLKKESKSWLISNNTTFLDWSMGFARVLQRLEINSHSTCISMLWRAFLFQRDVTLVKSSLRELISQALLGRLHCLSCFYQTKLNCR